MTHRTSQVSSPLVLQGIGLGFGLKTQRPCERHARVLLRSSASAADLSRDPGIPLLPFFASSSVSTRPGPTLDAAQCNAHATTPQSVLRCYLGLDVGIGWSLKRLREAR